MRKTLFRVCLPLSVMFGVVLIVAAQAPPPRDGFRGRGPGGPGGPMNGMFADGRLVGRFGGKTIKDKAFQANFTDSHMETLTDNSITTNTTGVVARDSDGSTYDEVTLSAIGPWASSGKAHEFIYIRNLMTMMDYIVDVPGKMYQAIVIPPPPPNRGSNPKFQGPPPGKAPNSRGLNNVTVSDNPSGTYIDPVTMAPYPFAVDDKITTRMIPKGQIGNVSPIVITSERWYLPGYDLVLGETTTDPRFGTTSHLLSNIVLGSASVSFTPDPSFTPEKSRNFHRGPRGAGKQPPVPPPAD